MSDAVTALPTAPARTDPTTFSARGDAFLAALATFVTQLNVVAAAFNLTATSSTSTTSLTIGTGAQSLTVDLAKSYLAGMSVKIAHDSTNWMHGEVTSYNSGTGALVVNVTNILGSGTETAWTITLSGPIGLAGVTATAAEINALAGTGLSSTELGFLNGATAGTQVASKAVIADASINIGISKVTQLHIGASGSETQVTATAAEINTACDGITATAAQINALLTGDHGDITVTSSGATYTIDAAVVNQSKLKTTLGEVSVSVPLSDSAFTAVYPGGEYGFMFQVKGENATFLTYSAGSAISLTTSYLSHKSSFTNSSGIAAYMGYIQQRYVASSGEVFWLFILRDQLTKKVQSMYAAPDHPCFGNGGKPALMPHPFLDYKPETQEIIVINPSKEQIAEMEAQRFVDADDIPDLSFLEVLQQFYEIDEESNPAWPIEEVTVGLPSGHNWVNMIGQKVKPIKKVIPQPEGILVKSLREKIK